MFIPQNFRQVNGLFIVLLAIVGKWVKEMVVDVINEHDLLSLRICHTVSVNGVNKNVFVYVDMYINKNTTDDEIDRNLESIRLLYEKRLFRVCNMTPQKRKRDHNSHDDNVVLQKRKQSCKQLFSEIDEFDELD